MDRVRRNHQRSAVTRNWWAGRSGSSLAAAFRARVIADGGAYEAQACQSSQLQTLLPYYDASSLILTPNGYKETKLYSTKPTNGGGDFAFVRASTDTRRGPSLVEEIPYNFLTTSKGLSAWTNASGGPISYNNATAPDGTLTATKFTEGVALSQQGLYLTAGYPYKTGSFVFSLYAKAGTTPWISLGFGNSEGAGCAKFDLSAGTKLAENLATGSIVSVGNGWYRLSITKSVVAGTNFPEFWTEQTSAASVTRLQTGTSKDLYVWGAQLEVGTTPTTFFNTTDRFNVPALDYTGSTCPKLQLEPQRTNLLLRSEEFDNASWTKNVATVTANSIVGPDGLTTADSFFETAVTNKHYVQQQISKAASPIQYTVSVFAKPNGRNWLDITFWDAATVGIEVWFDLANGLVGGNALTGVGFSLQSASIVTFGNGWYRCIATITTNSIATAAVALGGASADLTSSTVGDITKGVYLWGAQLEAGAYATSYIPTTSATVTRLADVVSPLFPTGTNLLLQSQTVDNASWTKGAITVTPNSTAAPDSTVTADTILETATTTDHFLQQSVTKAAASITYTLSIYAKPNGRNYIWLKIDDAATAAAGRYFDVSTGVVTGGAITIGTGISVLSSSITPAANGFYRCAVVISTNNIAVARVQIGTSNDGTTTTTVGDITKGLFVWGAQLELGSSATTYLPTTTTMVHDGSIIGQTQGTLFATLSYNTTSVGDLGIFAISDGTISNRMLLYYDSTQNKLGLFINNAAVTQANVLSSATTIANTTYKIAMTYQNNKAAFFLNGVKQGEDLTVTVPACFRIGVGESGAGTVFFSGMLQNAVLFPTALSDAQAITLTT